MAPLKSVPPGATDPTDGLEYVPLVVLLLARIPTARSASSK
jgi:hypothetical protein